MDPYRKYFPAAAALAVILLAWLTFLPVKETEFVLITQFGRHQRILQIQQQAIVVFLHIDIAWNLPLLAPVLQTLEPACLWRSVSSGNDHSGLEVPAGRSDHQPRCWTSLDDQAGEERSTAEKAPIK